MKAGDVVRLTDHASNGLPSQEWCVLLDQGGSPLYFVIDRTFKDPETEVIYLFFKETEDKGWKASEFCVVRHQNRADIMEDDSKNRNAFAVFQKEIDLWVNTAFNSAVNQDGDPIVTNEDERNYRFFEESCELVQSLKMTRAQAHKLVDMVWDKVPEPNPLLEVGGTLSTLAALCNVHRFDMWRCAVAAIQRNWDRIDIIRQKQKLKPSMREVKVARSMATYEEVNLQLVAKLGTINACDQALIPTPKLRWNMFGRLEQLYQGEPRGEFTESKWVEVPTVR